mgnify:CR=1 FL=1|tara:strand:+ start:1934 stop:2728 length:795 start_codon:yes stop_codon:yes gene_type:complete
MANNKLYGYKPKYGKGNVGTPYGEDIRFVNQNPFEFRKGMDYELTSLGCSRLAESTPDEREKATESVLGNLKKHPSYYTAKIQWESKGRNYGTQGTQNVSFNKWLKEFFDNTKMQEVIKSFDRDKMKSPTFKDDKMTEPKYNKSDYTVALKEAIKNKVRKKLLEAKKKDDFDIDSDVEPTTTDIKTADLKGIQDAVLDTKDALAHAQKRVKDLGPDIKKLAKEVNSKIKKNPSNKEGYLKVYQSDPDVEEFIKLRKMLKSAGLL